MNKHTVLKGPDAIVGEKSRALHALWRKLTGDRLAPKREEITLSLVRNLTPWLWTVDVVDNGADFRFRLTGDRVTQFLDGCHAGMLLSELPINLFFERLRHTLAHCVEHRRPVAVGPVRSGYEGKEHWEVEAVVLPLSEDGKTINCLMGAMEIWPIGSNGAAH
ncbi:MAG: PAS domain-containing protein [Rhizomicrobium sp.]|jgi:hypothetical protein